MTDLEMDLMLARAEIAELKRQLGKECSFGAGITVKPDGVNELDPCVYEDIEVHTNVTVVVKKCLKCGHIEWLWYRQENTEDFVGDDLNG